MSVKVEKVADCRIVGEGPHWDVETQSLYYIDIFGKSLHRYIPATNTHTKAVIGTEPISFIKPIDGAPNKFLISVGRELATLTWDGVSDKVSDIQKIAEVDVHEEARGNRINDGKCDASGRLWFGTMGAEPEFGHVIPNIASFYSLEPNGQVKLQLRPISVSNGLTWNADNTKFYYIDSGSGEIYQFDFDMANAEISNKKVIFSLKELGIEGFADGQTIDTDGNLWIAIFDASRVIKIDPKKYNGLLQTVNIPAKQVTAVTFGGPNLDELYVTTASVPVDGVILSPPDHGAVYKVTGLGVKGYPAVKAKIL